MVAIGGSIEEVSLAGRIYSVPADVDTGRKLGGFENEFQPNGDGSGRLVKTRTGWAIDGLAVGVVWTSLTTPACGLAGGKADLFPIVGVKLASHWHGVTMLCPPALGGQ